MLLTDQISLSGYLYSLGYWAICVLQLFIVEAVTSYILKLTLAFFSSPFSTLPKSQYKNLDISRTKRAYGMI